MGLQRQEFKKGVVMHKFGNESDLEAIDILAENLELPDMKRRPAKKKISVKKKVVIKKVAK